MKHCRFTLAVVLNLCACFVLTLKAAASTKDVPNLSCSFVGIGADMLLWAETPNGPGRIAIHPRDGLGLIKWKLRILNEVLSRADPRENKYSPEGRLIFESTRWKKHLFRVEKSDHVTYVSADPTWAELVVIDVAANEPVFAGPVERPGARPVRE